MVHVCRQAVDEGWVPGQVVGHTGRIRAQGDGAEDPCGEQIRTEATSLGSQVQVELVLQPLIAGIELSNPSHQRDRRRDGWTEGQRD